MANVINACPDEHVFEKLGRNELPQSERETILQHLEECETCARRASAFSGDDSLVNLVRQAGANPAAASAGDLVEDIRHLWPRAGDEQETLNLRGPAEKAGGPPRRPADVYDADPASTIPATGSAAVGPAPAQTGPYDFLAAPEQPDELGRLGSYRALEVLGSGGMGVVFRAEDMLLRRQAALKVMLPGSAADPSGKDRFLREARAAASIKHDHVVTIYQVDEEKGNPFIAMELLKGESLEKRLVRDKKLPAAEAVRIGREIAEGLAAAHDLGLVHRDIKPANIWLEPRKPKSKASEAIQSPSLSIPLADEGTVNQSNRVRVKILDFGLACGKGEDGKLTGKGVIVGTAAYMSPEQARGQTPDTRGDLFSLGCVLYKMCAGGQPFAGTDFVSTLVSIVSFTPRHLRDVDPTLPAEFANLVMQLLEKDPAQRPQSAHDVARTLAILEKSLRLARKERPRKTGWSSLRTGSAGSERTPFWRRTGVLIGLAVALALMVGGGAWLATIIFRVQMPTGILVIKTADKNIQVKISSGAEQVALVDLRDPLTHKGISLKVGKYDVELLDARDGLILKSRHFTIQDGQRSEIEVQFEPRLLFKEQEKPPPPPQFVPPPKDGKGFKKGPKGPKGFPPEGPDGPFPPPNGPGGPPPDKKQKGPPMRGFEPKGPRDEFMQDRRGF